MKIELISEISPSLISTFDCGNEDLNFYLKRFAKKNDKLGVGRTYVLLENSKAIGYYTVSMAQIEFDSLPSTSQKSLPRYPLPAVRLGRLAIQKNLQGNGYGEYLLMDSLARCQRVSSEVAIFAVIVDAKNNHAKKFYQRYGFIPFVNQELALFLPMGTIEQLSTNLR